jgi:hypothetical protein
MGSGTDYWDRPPVLPVLFYQPSYIGGYSGTTTNVMHTVFNAFVLITIHIREQSPSSL